MRCPPRRHVTPPVVGWGVANVRKKLPFEEERMPVGAADILVVEGLEVAQTPFSIELFEQDRVILHPLHRIELKRLFCRGRTSLLGFSHCGDRSCHPNSFLSRL